MSEGRVQEVFVAEDRIRGTMQGGPKGTQPFTAVRIDDPKLIEDLEKAGVKASGEMANKWVAEVIGWIIPLVLLIALWSFFFRRMGSAEGGVMSFARSRAKIYADDDVKVRFGDARVWTKRKTSCGRSRVSEDPAEVHEHRGTDSEGRVARGPPGTERRARTSVPESPVALLSLIGSEFVEMFVGVGAARVRDLSAGGGEGSGSSSSTARRA